MEKAYMRVCECGLMAENRGTKYISCILCGAIIPRLGIFLSGVNQDYKIWKYVILRDTDKTKNDYQYEIQVCDVFKMMPVLLL